MRHFFIIVACVMAASWAMPVFADAPVIDPADDHKYFGPGDDILFWTPEQKVSGFRNINRLYWTRGIWAGDNPFPLPYDRVDLSELQFEYEDTVVTIDDYVKRHNVAGLLIIKDGKIVYERYELGNTPESLWLSWSVAKSVTSMLVGAAIHDGYIESIDEKVSDYLPRLKSSSYDRTSIRNLLQMASGVEGNEDYADRKADINTMQWDTLSVYAYLKQKPRVAEPGETFNYNTAETNLVGTLLRAAIGNNLSTYLSEKIWQPFGMEFNGNWQLTEAGGGEFGGSGLSASLRDYGRIGLFALRNGYLADGTQVLPDNWMADSTVPSKGRAAYGYLWWLRGEGVYAASGIFGQAIHIDPVHELVIAQHSARDAASQAGDWALQREFFRAVTAALGD
ncbi:MAG: serine hydrolase [Proteobacteria bacterium]|nr:serine hydrolase [Pseudomonadota bacterium]